MQILFWQIFEVSHTECLSSNKDKRMKTIQLPVKLKITDERHLKKAVEYNCWNIEMITIKMRSLVQVSDNDNSSSWKSKNDQICTKT